MKTIKYEVIRYKYCKFDFYGHLRRPLKSMRYVREEVVEEKTTFQYSSILSRQERNKIGVYLFNTGVGYCANGLNVPVWVP